MTGGREPTECLEQQGGLADAGLPTQQRGGAFGESAPEHTVELADAGGPPRRPRHRNIGDGARLTHRPLDHRPAARRATHLDGRPDDKLLQGAPLFAVGTAAEPLSRFGPATAAAIGRARPRHDPERGTRL